MTPVSPQGYFPQSAHSQLAGLSVLFQCCPGASSPLCCPVGARSPTPSVGLASSLSALIISLIYPQALTGAPRMQAVGATCPVRWAHPATRATRCVRKAPAPRPGDPPVSLDRPERAPEMRQRLGGTCKRRGPLLEAVGGQVSPREGTAGAKPQAASPGEEGMESFLPNGA